MALFADDDFSLAMHLFHHGLPLRHLVKFMIARFFAFFVVFIAVHEHHHISVLFDRAGFAQIGQLRAFVFAAFHLARQLRQGHDRDVQFFGDGF